MGQFDVAGNAQMALSDQALSCTIHDFELAVPKLAAFTEYLKIASHLRGKEHYIWVERYNKEITALSDEFRRLLAAGTRPTIE